MVGTNLNTEIDSNDNCSLTDETGLCILGTSEGTPGTNTNVYQVGCIITDTVNGIGYTNTGTSGTPTWTALSTGGVIPPDAFSPQGVLQSAIFIDNALAPISTDATSLYSLVVDGNSSISQNPIPTITANSLTTITNKLSITNNLVLTNVYLPVLASVGNAGITFTQNSLLTSVNLPNLTTNTGSFGIGSNNSLTTISAPLLTNIPGGLNLSSNTAVTSIDFTALTSVQSLSMENMTALSTVSFPSLTTIPGFINISGGGITTISFPNLVTVTNQVSITSCDDLVSVDLSSFTTSNPAIQVSVNTSPQLTTITLNSAISATQLFFHTNALSTASVDDILLKLDTAGNSNGLLFLTGGTNSAPTGGAGNANLLSLQGKGWSVSTN